MEKKNTVVFCDKIQKGHDKLYAGIEIVARAVGATMGPKGKLVLIKDKNGKPFATKDGVTVSKSINLHNSVEDMGAKLIQEAASQTNDKAGDGTTTSTVLAAEMIRHVRKYLSAGIPPRDIVTSMNFTLDACLQELDKIKKSTKSIQELRQIAYISSNNDDNLADLISDAVSKTPDGIVTIEESKNAESKFDLLKGLHFDKGYASPYFVNDAQKGRVAYDNVLIFAVDGKITSFSSIVPVLEYAVQKKQALLIIADEFEGDVLPGIVTNRNKSQIKICAVRTPYQGNDKKDFLKDLSVISGGTIFSSSETSSYIIDEKSGKFLGKVAKIEVYKNKCIIVANTDQLVKIEDHASNLHQQLMHFSMGALSESDMNMLRLRISKLKGSIGIIRVGGSTETEMIERKHRIEDALNATRAAEADGIVPGGGVALLDVYRSLSNSEKYSPIIIESLKAPFSQIMKNADIEPPLYINKLMSEQNSTGYDVLKSQFVKMYDSGIVDPVTVTKSALIHAVSVAAIFASLDAIITD